MGSLLRVDVDAHHLNRRSSAGQIDTEPAPLPGSGRPGEGGAGPGADALYCAPTPDSGFVSAANLTPQHAQSFMPLIFYTMLALVQEFLPHMLEQGDGAILTAQAGRTVQGLPNMSGPSPAQAAQRNYLQALHAEVAGRGVYVGMLCIGAAIRNSAFHAEMEKAEAAGHAVWKMPTVDPEHLAGLLWAMDGTRGQREVVYP